jgi:hypothetical protein
MVNNATKIKKSNSYLSRQVIKEKRARYMLMEMMDRHPVFLIKGDNYYN